jgi:hypothetical protein
MGRHGASTADSDGEARCQCDASGNLKPPGLARAAAAEPAEHQPPGRAEALAATVAGVPG